MVKSYAEAMAWADMRAAAAAETAEGSASAKTVAVDMLAGDLDRKTVQEWLSTVQ